MMSCDIIRDLLPLFDDNAASEASIQVIRAHIKSCPHCRLYHHYMKKRLKSPPNITATSAKYNEVARQIRRTRYLMFGSAAILLATSLGYNILTLRHKK